MSKKSILPQSRHHVMVYDEDWEFLLTYCRDRAEENLGPGTVVRELIHRRVMGLREKMNQAVDAIGGAAAEGASR